MKIKISDLKQISNTLDEVRGFVSVSLDFADDYQTDYIFKLLDEIDKSVNLLDKVIK